MNIFNYENLKKIEWINYYILGPQNNNWKETFRNPFYGIKQFLSVENKNATSIIDLRIYYKPYKNGDPVGAKRTNGSPLIRIWNYHKTYKLFEIKKFHPVDALYINGWFTFSFNLTKFIFPWISINFRPMKKHYFNFGIGWEGTDAKDAPRAELGIKCRIADYESQCKWNPSVVAPDWHEGHI